MEQEIICAFRFSASDLLAVNYDCAVSEAVLSINLRICESFQSESFSTGSMKSVRV